MYTFRTKDSCDQKLFLIFLCICYVILLIFLHVNFFYIDPSADQLFSTKKILMNQLKEGKSLIYYAHIVAQSRS